MADEYTTSGNWWERNRFEAATPPSTSSGLTSVGSFGWLMDMAPAASSAAAHDMKSTPSPNSSSIDHSLGVGFNLGGGGAETNLQMMSSQTVDWNQQNLLLRGDKPSDQMRFRSMQQQDNNVVSQERVSVGSSQVQWRPASSESFIMQNQHSGFENSSINGCGYSNSYHQSNYNAGLLNSDHEQLLPQFLRAPPRKPPPSANSGQLHFSNNWNNASTAANSPPMIDVRPSFLPPIQSQFSSPNFEEKPNKNLLEVSTKPRKTVPKKSGSQTTNKKPRSEAQAPLPAFKVRKEKVGDRITTLQQLVSPFGKTDTASVLTEAIDYINFLHDKVYELSIPYMKNGVTMLHHLQNFEKSELDLEEPKQDLQSRGLCLVPLSSTYPVCTAQETNFDFWNPTLGGTFR